MEQHTFFCVKVLNMTVVTYSKLLNFPCVDHLLFIITSEQNNKLGIIKEPVLLAKSWRECCLTNFYLARL